MAHCLQFNHFDCFIMFHCTSVKLFSWSGINASYPETETLFLPSRSSKYRLCLCLQFEAGQDVLNFLHFNSEKDFLSFWFWTIQGCHLCGKMFSRHFKKASGWSVCLLNVDVKLTSFGKTSITLLQQNAFRYKLKKM